MQQRVMKRYKLKSAFCKRFIEWLREKMVSCWGLNLREFDRALIKSTHLIRAELSRNKLGYKTFIGYTYKDISPVPYICNETNRIMPKLGKIKMSSPKNVNDLLEEFLVDIDKKKRKAKVKKRETCLLDYGKKKEKMRPCVEIIYSDKFKDAGDGYQRGMFILANELKEVYGPSEALTRLHDWNSRMGYPIKEEDLNYRITMKSYTLNDTYVNEFLDSVGMNS